MPIIKTPRDLGQTIRSRRKQLGWDQAQLAKQIGASRQWVIDIEKGKPRAELALALRALNALGLLLHVGDQASRVPIPSSSANHTALGRRSYTAADIDRIIESNKNLEHGRNQWTSKSPSMQVDKLMESSNPAARLNGLVVKEQSPSYGSSRNHDGAVNSMAELVKRIRSSSSDAFSNASPADSKNPGDDDHKKTLGPQEEES